MRFALRMVIVGCTVALMGTIIFLGSQIAATSADLHQACSVLQAHHLTSKGC